MTETPQQSKDIYFYSEYCKYCEEATKYINERNFVKVNIDMNDVPEFIDRVPAILTSNKKVLYEDVLFEYLMNLKKKNEELNTEPFMVHEMKGLSDRYSYMDDTNTFLNHSFDFLDSPTKIITPTESDVKKIMNYDEILAQRDNDLKNNIGL
jgi:hypothetical protein|tara:strand:- start:4053 stop:4508 length:456 start_codon:yes stop_codon:yes gene_type:complete